MNSIPRIRNLNSTNIGCALLTIKNTHSRPSALVHLQIVLCKSLQTTSSSYMFSIRAPNRLLLIILPRYGRTSHAAAEDRCHLHDDSHRSVVSHRPTSRMFCFCYHLLQWRVQRKRKVAEMDTVDDLNHFRDSCWHGEHSNGCSWSHVLECVCVCWVR